MTPPFVERSNFRHAIESVVKLGGIVCEVAGRGGSVGWLRPGEDLVEIAGVIAEAVGETLQICPAQARLSVGQSPGVIAIECRERGVDARYYRGEAGFGDRESSPRNSGIDKLRAQPHSAEIAGKVHQP